MSLQSLANMAAGDRMEEVRGIHIKNDEVIALTSPISGVGAGTTSRITPTDESMGVPMHGDVFQLSQDRSLQTFGFGVGGANNPQAPHLYDPRRSCPYFSSM